LALNFPDNPTINQVYSDYTAGFYYKWDGTVWQSYSPSSSGNIKTLDDISGSFNGIGQTFGLTSGGVSITPLNAGQLVINLGGVVQSPAIDYTVLSSNITFTTPPGGGLSFSGISLGPAVPLTNIASGFITPDKLSTGAPWWQTNYNVGIGTTLPTSALNVIGDGNFTGVITATTFKGQINSGISTLGITSISQLNVSGISTLGVTSITNLTVQQVTVASNTTTALIVQGDARITGILTIGTGSIVLNGSNNNITGIASITDTSNRKLVALNTGGTNVALWYQASAPTGWTKLTAHHDKALRVVNTSGGGSGGSTGFTTAFTSRSGIGTVAATTLNTTQMPTHNHSTSIDAYSVHAYGYNAGRATASGTDGPIGFSMSSAGGSTSHTHGFALTMDFAVQYVDMILCSFD